MSEIKGGKSPQPLKKEGEVGVLLDIRRGLLREVARVEGRLRELGVIVKERQWENGEKQET